MKLVESVRDAWWRISYRDKLILADTLLWAVGWGIVIWVAWHFIAKYW